LREIAAETVTIVSEGRYVAPSGATVTIADDVWAAVGGTRLYQPDDPLPDPQGTIRPRVDVTTESTMEAARRLLRTRAGPDPAALVFASARNPGGGFLRGARAQEEDIARASALAACLSTQPSFYTIHRGDPDLRYSDRVIYSPRVPVFRDDDGELLEQPYRLSFLTAAAPNLAALRANQPERVDSVPAVLRARAERVLRVAAAHGHRQLVLGAWGCGVFANSPIEVAGAFRAALDAVPCFDTVVFAILDRTGDGPTYRVFVDTFASGSAGPG
jgi:uncharacterized protein (TIGR02452 family)